MNTQEVLDGIDKAIDVMLTYEQDEKTTKIIQALNDAWDIIYNKEEIKL
jgi:hypothetical protein